MTIRTNSVFAKHRNIGQFRILVSKYWPRGKSWHELNLDMHLSELGPSRTLLSKYKDQLKSADQLPFSLYIDEYVSELKENPKAIRALQLLDRLELLVEIELLCFEPEGEPCHRYTIKEIIDKERWWVKDANY